MAVAGEFLHQFIGHHCASQSKRRGDGMWAHASVLLRMVACETQDFASLLWLTA